MKKLNNKELEGFAKEIRKVIFKNLKEENKENKENKSIKNNLELKKVHDIILEKLRKIKLFNKNMEQILTVSESVLIIKNYAKQVNGNTWLINDSQKTCAEIAQDIFSRVINNTLSKLSSEGVLDCHYDSEENDFIFHVKE
jgi:hypothetical protein